MPSACRNVSHSTFPIFVPSLSWQMFCFFKCKMASPKRRFPHLEEIRLCVSEVGEVASVGEAFAGDDIERHYR